MTRVEVFSKLSDIFKDVFFDDEIEISDATRSSDVEGWDSLSHITLIGTIEDEFGIRFDMDELLKMNDVGAMVDAIMELLR
jgi:acyl carrier protein